MPELSKRGRRNWDDLAGMDEVFDRWLSDWFPFRTFRFEPALDVDWKPAIDVIDKVDHILVKANLPGIKKEDIDVSVTDDTLTLKGKMERSDEEKGESYYRSERVSGSFGRVFRLPTEVDNEKVKAKLENGILELTLPKKEPKKTSEIQIEVK
jgi:HSP20 family protein